MMAEKKKRRKTVYVRGFDDKVWDRVFETADLKTILPA